MKASVKEFMSREDIPTGVQTADRIREPKASLPCELEIYSTRSEKVFVRSN
jgi:hypothetical protein